MALSGDGSIFTWGWNWNGQLGHGDTIDRRTPTLIKALALFRALKQTIITSIAAGAQHSLALTSTGELYSWGGNDEGQLGRDEDPPAIPQMILGLHNRNIVQIACGGTHSLALSQIGDVYSWGRGSRFSSTLLTSYFSYRVQWSYRTWNRGYHLQTSESRRYQKYSDNCVWVESLYGNRWTRSCVHIWKGIRWSIRTI
jgi:alpha-tubulin suppressor-like RCC1 family protein